MLTFTFITTTGYLGYDREARKLRWVRSPDSTSADIQLRCCTARTSGAAPGLQYRRITFAGDLIATDQDALNPWLTTWRDEHGGNPASCLSNAHQEP